MLILKKIVCMCNHAHNNIRDTSVGNIYIYFRYIYKLWRAIMLDNKEHNVNHNYIIYH